MLFILLSYRPADRIDCRSSPCMNSLNAMSLREKRRGGGGEQRPRNFSRRARDGRVGHQGAPNRSRLEGRGEPEAHTFNQKCESPVLFF